MVAAHSQAEKRLLNLGQGQAGHVDRFDQEALAGKLMAIGILPGSRVEVVRRAPFGGGYYVRVDRQTIALRKQELECIIVK